MALVNKLMTTLYVQNFVLMLGLVVSFYGLAVELMLDKDPSYKPICDVSETVSCSRALHSEFGTGLGLVRPLLGAKSPLNQKNAAYGLAVYLVLLILGNVFSSSRRIAQLYIVASWGMNLLSLYLIGVLIYLRTLCLVCLCIYIVNFALLILSYRRLICIKAMEQKKRL